MSFEQWSCMGQPGNESVETLCWLLACLRQQYMLYQNAHWQSNGEAFYSNHQLFQRIYQGEEEDETGGVQADVDALAERMVGLFGTPCVDMQTLMPKMVMFCQRWCKIPCHHRRALASEADFQRAVQLALKTLEAEGRLTVGLENLLQDMADRHEVNMYLIQQTLRRPGE